MKYRFSRMEKLKSRKLISQLFSKNSHVFSYPVKLVWTARKDDNAEGVQVMISVSKRTIRQAVQRNRVKRLIRESYRKNKSILLNSDMIDKDEVISLGFIYVGKEVLGSAEIEKGVVSALKKMKKVLIQD